MNRLNKLFRSKNNVLNVYTTAGYPELNSTVEVVKELNNNGVDIIEIGMPYSDPLADGETIQNASQIAIKNGITLDVIFKQIKEIRESLDIPIVLMGYYNQLLQYGETEFFNKAKEVGVDGFIIPDLPVDIYIEKYKSQLEDLGLKMTLLITPQTSEDRIKLIDKETSGFLYIVSSYALTGVKNGISDKQLDYFERIKKMNLTSPKLIGFGISDKKSFETANQFAEGAIIGSAFIKVISDSKNLKEDIKRFINNLR